MVPIHFIWMCGDTEILIQQLYNHLFISYLNFCKIQRHQDRTLNLREHPRLTTNNQRDRDCFILTAIDCQEIIVFIVARLAFLVGSGGDEERKKKQRLHQKVFVYSLKCPDLFISIFWQPARKVVLQIVILKQTRRDTHYIRQDIWLDLNTARNGYLGQIQCTFLGRGKSGWRSAFKILFYNDWCTLYLSLLRSAGRMEIQSQLLSSNLLKCPHHREILDLF